MKRLLLVATLALLASTGLATTSQASGAFGLFYCPKYCASYCQACCPHNAFSSNGCLMGCCPPPVWPYSGYGCGGCGAYGACGYGAYGAPGCGHKGCKGGGCGYGGFADPGCGPAGCGAPATGPCCRNKPPHALSLVQSSPQHFDPICCNCGMASYGNGGLRGTGLCYGGCAGGKCGKGNGGGGYCGPYVPGSMGPIPAPYPIGAYNPAMAMGDYGYDPSFHPQTAAQFWTANMNNLPATNLVQPVSYPGYGQWPNAYNPSLWMGYGYPQGW